MDGRGNPLANAVIGALFAQGWRKPVPFARELDAYDLSLDIPCDPEIEAIKDRVIANLSEARASEQEKILARRQLADIPFDGTGYLTDG